MPQWIKSQGVTIQMKATHLYFPVVLFMVLYKGILPFVSACEILKCDHANEGHWAVLSYGAVYYVVRGGSYFWVCGWNPELWPFKWKLLRRSSLWLLCCTRWFKLFRHWIKSQSVTILMKTTGQYFPVILFILYSVVHSCDDVHVIYTCLSLCFISHKNWFFFFPAGSWIEFASSSVFIS